MNVFLTALTGGGTLMMFSREFGLASSLSSVKDTLFVFLSVCADLLPFNFALLALICADLSAARFPPRAAIFLTYVSGSGSGLITLDENTQ